MSDPNLCTCGHHAGDHYQRTKSSATSCIPSPECPCRGFTIPAAFDNGLPAPEVTETTHYEAQIFRTMPQVWFPASDRLSKREALTVYDQERAAGVHENHLRVVRVHTVTTVTVLQESEQS